MLHISGAFSLVYGHKDIYEFLLGLSERGEGK